MGRYLYRVGLALSILLNVVAGGHPNQTFSARNYEWQRTGRPNLVRLINWLLRDKDHCVVDWVNWKLIEKVLHKYGCRR